MLDTVLPEYDFAERHQRLIHADTEATWRALTELTLGDLTLTRPLMALRHLGRSQPPDRPLLTEGPIKLLYREDGHLAVAGAIARPWQPRAPRRNVADLAEFAAFDHPGWTKYLTEFRVEPAAGGCTLSTETRGISTDVRARRWFQLYWMLIRVPSGLIRRDILRSVARTVAVAGRPRVESATGRRVT